MALTDESGMNTTMLVSPTGGNGGGFGGFDGNSGWWIILLFILLGGWGNGYGNGGAPYVANDVQRGFDQNAVMNGINGLTANVSNGFSEVQQTLCNGFANAEIANNARQIANMQNTFNAQTAITQGMNDISMGLQNCCCENRAATADLKYTVATEACADRSAISQALTDVLVQNNANTQKILDQMCADRINAKDEKIAELQNQLTMAQIVANNNAQTQTLINDNLAQTGAIERYLAPTPIPAYVVQNPNCCAQYGGCGCGM